MISARYAMATAALVAVALVPTVIHSYLGQVIDDGCRVRTIPTSIAGLRATPTSRQDRWVRETYDAYDWIERRYTDGTKTVILFVARSYDPKRLYHHPELGVLHGMDLRDAGRMRFGGRLEVPARVLRGAGSGRPHLALYSLLYGNDFVENPYTFQVMVSYKLLFLGRQPMTLFLVHDPAFPMGASLQDAVASRVLVEAINGFLRQVPCS